MPKQTLNPPLIHLLFLCRLLSVSLYTVFHNPIPTRTRYHATFPAANPTILHPDSFYNLTDSCGELQLVRWNQSQAIDICLELLAVRPPCLLMVLTHVPQDARARQTRLACHANSKLILGIVSKISFHWVASLILPDRTPRDTR
jgi:hypothetical protein